MSEVDTTVINVEAHTSDMQLPDIIRQLSVQPRHTSPGNGVEHLRFDGEVDVQAIKAELVALGRSVRGNAYFVFSNGKSVPVSYETGKVIETE